MLHSKIRLLNEYTINKIAAGEVIENPASVIKELVENSLDAGATTICVEIQEGGRQLIRVSDNGCGMSHDDAVLCIERYATSKIKKVEDIHDISTMGFRGEALSSIVAISKCTLLTSPYPKDENNSQGTRIVIEGGRILSCLPAPRSQGTTIEVKSLFFNVPVRRNFQKSPSYDVQQILKMMQGLVLGYPSIQFELLSDQKILLKTTVTHASAVFLHLLGKRIETVLGQSYSSSLLSLRFQQAPYEIIGYIGSPASHKANRSGQYLFINQRMVYSALIATAIQEGYSTMLPTRRYPVFILHLYMPGSLVDVNVHPQKKEIRLRQEFQLKETIRQAIQVSLRANEYHQQEEKEEGKAEFLVEKEKKPLLPEEENPSLSSSPWSSYVSLLSPRPQVVSEEKWEFKNNATEYEQQVPPLTPFIPTSTISPPEEEILPVLPINHPAPQVLATLAGYFLIDAWRAERLIGHAYKKQGGFILLDQRAAYSRIYYEKFLHHSTLDLQTLLLPFTLHFCSAEAALLSTYSQALHQLGFYIREFGSGMFKIDAYPSFLKEDQLENCIPLLLQDLLQSHTTKQLQVLQNEELALAACRASLPSTKCLSLEEAQMLLDRLMACEIPSQCPFGKPICIYITAEEIAKWFQKS
jgi:DNA mismatch repair protein MutL